MLRALFSIALIATASFLVGGCATAPSTDSGKAALSEESNDVLVRAVKDDPSIKKLSEEAAGYAVFPTVGKGAIGIGGAYGKGVLYEKGAVVGYCDLTQGSIGFALGGQAYSEIVFFETPQALSKFKSGNFAFDAQASAVAVKSGVGANAKYAGGVAVFTMGEAGLMYEASIGGQKFSYLPK